MSKGVSIYSAAIHIAAIGNGDGGGAGCIVGAVVAVGDCILGVDISVRVDHHAADLGGSHFGQAVHISALVELDGADAGGLRGISQFQGQRLAQAGSTLHHIVLTVRLAGAFGLHCIRTLDLGFGQQGESLHELVGVDDAAVEAVIADSGRIGTCLSFAAHRGGCGLQQLLDRVDQTDVLLGAVHVHVAVGQSQHTGDNRGRSDR